MPAPLDRSPLLGESYELGEDFHYLETGDVVRIEPERGAIRALYRRNSRSNSFLVTERCAVRPSRTAMGLRRPVSPS